MSVAPHAGNKKRKKSESKPHSQINKCLNEKRRREQENIHIEELAELVSASPSDMSSLSCKPDKCAILKETVNQIRSQKTSTENELCDELQQSEVSSSKPNIINNQIFGAILLEALEGFLFIVNNDGKVGFISENVSSYLKFTQDEVFEKNIYNFIHPDDRARFNSNLLLMMPLGNGRDWSTDNTYKSGKPAKHFNCRFLVKQEEPEIKMENKQPQEPQYESLNITANYITLEDSGNEETRNGLSCIARRATFEDKRIGSNKVEQFTTRMNRDGKITDIDATMLSASCSQYLHKELLGSAMTDLCHPNDLATLKQHLKETLESDSVTCVLHKFRIGHDRFARIKTKSKYFQASPNDDYVVSTHSVIRDNDTSNSNFESQRSIPSPQSVASTSSGPGSVSDSSTSLNGSIVLSPMNLPNSFGNYSNSLNSTNNTEFGLGDLVLEMFPGSNWNMDPASAQSKESDCTSVTSFVSSPQTAPLSNRSETSAAASPTNSAFVSGLASSRSGSSVPSPAMQSRAPTPYGGTCYSPSGAQQSNNGRSSPSRALPAKSDSLNSSSTDTSGINSISSQGMRIDRQQFDIKSNQKLRNLLTQSSTDDSASRQTMRQTSQDEVTVLIDSRVLDDSNRMSRPNPQQSVPRTSNVILRDLLNQDDSEVPVEPIYKCAESAVPNPLLNAGSCKTTENSAQQRLGNNNMLRKLLNNDDSDKSYHKSQDLIHQLLISNSSNKVSVQNNRMIFSNASNSLVTENSVPKQMSAASRQVMPDVTYVTETSAVKRKAVDKPSYTSTTKKPGSGSNHAHLAGLNPMLAEMLAKTPSSEVEVPTSMATSLITQLPQDKLPKHLEKKLVHTPAISATTSSLVFTSAAPMVQRDIVTSDGRGHVMQQQPTQLVQSALRTVYTQQQQQQQQQLFDKLVSGTDDDLILAKSMTSELLNAATATSVSNSAAYAQLLSAFNNTTTNANNLTVPTSDITVSASLSNLLSDNTLAAQTSLADSLQTSQGADTNFENIILETIYSLQEDHNLTTPQKATNPATILKILSDPMEFPETSTTSLLPTPVSVNNSQDINEKIAISAIQKELMEAGSAAIASKANNIQTASVIPTYSQAGRSLTQVSRTHVQAQLTSEQILLLQQQQLVSGSLPPNYNLVANRVRLPVTTQSSVNVLTPEILAQVQRRQLMTQNPNMGMSMNQIRKSMKQRLYLQQQQKRLLEQQKQQRTIPTQQPLEVASTAGTASFPENINDLLNNTVAPNVTLTRSTGIPEVARFNLNSTSSLPSPTSQASPTSAQLSPGQRVNQASPFSPLSQQAFPSQTPPPSTYQAARLSPHPPPSYPQGGTSHSPSPITPTDSSPHMVLSPQSPQWTQRLATSPIQNLQLQNPMLNAQLSQQASIGANQIRLTAQQRQQLALRSMPSPTSVQSSRGAVFSPQPEANFSPLSPVMVLQTQAPQQQRIQRSRMASGSQSQTNFSTEPLLSPQSLPSPSFSQSVSTTPTSTFVSISSSPVPVSYSATQASQHFTFERQNIKAFTSSPNDSLRSPVVSNDQGTSDSLRQDLRSLVNSQNRLILSSNNQQLLQSLSSNSVSQLMSAQTLTREDLEDLGLSVELLPSGSTEAQSASQTLYAQALLNETIENSVQPTSPRVHVEEPRPADQKKSLLQQLLSEPT
ncbi:nuclear receptor coactivator 1 [Trichonephila clavata]|uniref:Nuclear receptor coactivator 1 n=1 Tax=Trichonephila clavata TaxID=2740835 RepID=A0A8X6JXF3_TRICU|nr:nuclear receptor coactivator 1 [Trichonephila clavata]